MRTVSVVRETFEGRPAYDTAVSRAVLGAVAAGEIPETFRIFVPDRIVAFGRRDRTRSGYLAAVAAVRELGFAPVERLAGGKAAVFHEQTLSFSWAIPTADPEESIHPRFEETSGVVAAALRSLGLDARVGAVPGEYCPGDFSVNIGGRRKVAGIGQRLVRGAAHVGGVIVVGRPDLVNRALVPAYRLLGYEWDPDATGAVADGNGATATEVADAVVAAIGAGARLVEGVIGAPIRARAADLEPDHAPSA
jgi:lipoate-protein ligase A